MILGYPARLARVKDLTDTLVDYGFDQKSADIALVSCIMDILLGIS